VPKTPKGGAVARGTKKPTGEDSIVDESEKPEPKKGGRCGAESRMVKGGGGSNEGGD